MLSSRGSQVEPPVDKNIGMNISELASVTAEAIAEKSVGMVTSEPTSVNAEQGFENGGLFSWMIPYLSMLGVEEGKRVLYGPIAVPVDPFTIPDEAEVTRRRKQAAIDLVNIGMEERNRRLMVGNAFTIISAIYVAWAALIADDGSLSGHILRFASAFPILFAVGFKLSAETGM